jgi:hypothetical protein
MSRLSNSERHFLSLIYPEGSIAVGSSVGLRLFQRGLVAITRADHNLLDFPHRRRIAASHRFVNRLSATEH